MATPSANPRSLELLLCAIPLICAYIDFVSLHIMIRIVTIGTYLKMTGNEYERFVFLSRKKGANPFIFETAALHGSSIVFNFVLIVLSFTKITDPRVLTAYFVAGFLGLLVAGSSWKFSTMKVQHVIELAEDHNLET